jgi:hypothetical protein
MTGKRYYMTTLGDWQRQAARFATLHFIVLDAPAPANDSPQSSGAFAGDSASAGAGHAAHTQPAKKVTVSCEPTHQFFAGRHAASVLTHNYTFSS